MQTVQSVPGVALNSESPDSDHLHRAHPRKSLFSFFKNVTINQYSQSENGKEKRMTMTDTAQCMRWHIYMNSLLTLRH